MINLRFASEWYIDREFVLHAGQISRADPSCWVDIRILSWVRCAELLGRLVERREIILSTAKRQDPVRSNLNPAPYGISVVISKAKRKAFQSARFSVWGW